jgi:hypothetical protein
MKQVEQQGEQGDDRDKGADDERGAHTGTWVLPAAARISSDEKAQREIHDFGLPGFLAVICAVSALSGRDVQSGLAATPASVCVEVD